MSHCRASLSLVVARGRRRRRSGAASGAAARPLHLGKACSGSVIRAGLALMRWRLAAPTLVGLLERLRLWVGVCVCVWGGGAVAAAGVAAVGERLMSAVVPPLSVVQYLSKNQPWGGGSSGLTQR